jgi:hypothetical protein
VTTDDAADATLRQAAQQMLAARPWDAATPARSAAEQCRNVLYIDWDTPSPQGVYAARCARDRGHAGRHKSNDGEWVW